jgi:hypothetical protein
MSDREVFERAKACPDVEFVFREPKCLVCGGKGFVQAAPLTGINTNSFGMLNCTAVGRNNHRRALWSRAVTVPCFACTEWRAAECTVET